MKYTKLLPVALLLSLVSMLVFPASAQQHRATRLGNPATRFAPPLTSPNDLRMRFKDATLKPDIISILRQWGWQGDYKDLFDAAMTALITEVKLPTGTRMPFMSSRENGRAVALVDVLWAGKEPISAYTFDFTSRGRFYRCITPRPCSNFYLEDLGAPALDLQCNAPAEVPAGRPVEIRLTLCNKGDATEPGAVVFLPIPPGAKLQRVSAGGTASGSNVTWQLANLVSNSNTECRATFTRSQPGAIAFQAAARGTVAGTVQTTCETLAVGIPAILIDAVDLEDPVGVAGEVTYDIKITNQGLIPCSNLRLTCTLPDNEQFVSGSGPTPVSADGGSITTQPLASFPSKQVVVWRVVVKALKPGDIRFKVNVSADQFTRPIYEEESTLLYE